MKLINACIGAMSDDNIGLLYKTHTYEEAYRLAVTLLTKEGMEDPQYFLDESNVFNPFNKPN